MTEQDRKRQRDFSEYDSLSTEALESILRADAQQLDDDDAILYIAEVLEKRAIAKHEYSFDVEAKKREFDQWYLPYLTDDKPLFREEADTRAKTADLQQGAPKKTGRRSKYLRLLCIAAITIAMLFASSLAVSAVWGTNLWSLLANWTNEVFGFSSHIEERTTEQVVSEMADVDSDKVFSSLQEALDAYGITEVKAPSVPDNFKVSHVEAGRDDAGLFFYACYSDGEAFLSISYGEFSSMPATIYEKTGKSVEAYQVKEITFYCFSNDNNNAIAWVTEHFECRIAGQASIKDLKAIANSIVK